MAFFGNFLKNYGKNAINEAVNGLNSAIVNFDPEGASEAEIMAIEEQFDQVNREYSKAKTEWQNEQKEADAIVALRDQRLQAAGILEQQANDGNEQAAEGLLQLIDSIESMQDDIEREVEEAQDAKEVMDELDATVKLYAEKLKTARSDMKKAMSAMKKAQKQQERAEERAERAARLAGIKKGASTLGSALETMNAKVAKAQEEADAANRKAEYLGKSGAEQNDAVAAAMAAASGEAPKATATVAERLAALRANK